MISVDTGRVLALIASAEKNGTWLSFEEAAGICGCTVADIPAIAAQLSTMAVPPFGPSDELDIVVEGDHLKIEAPAAWSRWSALPLSDVGLLVAALESLASGLDGPRRALAERLKSRLLHTLERGLAEDARGRSRAVAWGLSDDVVAGVYEALHPALEAREVVTLTYYNHSRDEVQERTVHPHRVVQHDGRWYLSASLADQVGHRLWRLDRVMGVSATGATFEGDGPGSEHFRRDVLYDKPPALVSIHLYVQPEAIGALCEALPDLVVSGEQAVLKAPTVRVGLRRLLAHADGWTVTAPPEAVAWLREV